MQTNPAAEQSKIIRWSESPWNQSCRKGQGLLRKGFAEEPCLVDFHATAGCSSVNFGWNWSLVQLTWTFSHNRCYMLLLLMLLLPLPLHLLLCLSRSVTQSNVIDRNVSSADTGHSLAIRPVIQPLRSRPTANAPSADVRHSYHCNSRSLPIPPPTHRRRLIAIVPYGTVYSLLRNDLRDRWRAASSVIRLHQNTAPIFFVFLTMQWKSEPSTVRRLCPNLFKYCNLLLSICCLRPARVIICNPVQQLTQKSS